VEIAHDVGFMHVCYPFQLSDGFVQVTAAYAMKYRPQVIVINSTVFPGATEEVERESGISAVYSPVRGKHLKMESELLHYSKFIAGNNRGAVERVDAHFQSLGIRTRIMSKPRALELAKLLETTYFGLLIAWAQEMERLATEVECDYREIACFFEEIGYLPPCVFQSGYIGGHCVMPNIALLKTHFHSEFLDAIERSNDKKAKELSSRPDKLRERIEPLPLRRP